MFGLKQSKMGKMKMGEAEGNQEGGYSNEVKSFSHHLYQNYSTNISNTHFHHLPNSLSPVSSCSLLSPANGFYCNSSEDDGSSSSPSFTPFSGEYDPSLFNLNQLQNVASARFSNSMFFGNSNEGSVESDLSEMFYDKMNIGVGKDKSNGSSVDFSHFVEKERDELGFVDCFSDGVSGYNVDNGVYDVGGYDSHSYPDAVFSNHVYPTEQINYLSEARNGKEGGYPGLYSSMLQQCGLESSLTAGQRMGGFVEKPTSNSSVNLNQYMSSGSEMGLDSEDSLILQGANLNYIVGKGANRSKSRKKKEKRAKPDIGFNFEGFCENDLKSKSLGALSFEGTGNLLSEVQGFIYYMAKDQFGCRFLQKIFDEGSIQDVQTIFAEIIDHVVELMTDQFGNYFVQKLLDVCSEEQRMHIIAMVTEKPGLLVTLCLNTHGTRAVQKLIETLKTRQQISLVIHALEPGFLALIKDVNGNHVIQRCLQCLNKEQNKFIFSGAAKFCIDIAGHQHGCCVLNRCIAHATGKDRDKLVNEISAHGFHLAQDPFGNYVIQYIIELKIPSAAAILLPQFEGNYVYLSMQKFSSHVIEKCLKHFEQSRSRIVHEFLSVPHFDQLLQDPFANYVIKSALEVTKGEVHTILVDAVQPHLLLRTNPYCKKIFSRNLLKK